MPCAKPLADYERELYTWINKREYTKLGWERDNATQRALLALQPSDIF